MFHPSCIVAVASLAWLSISVTPAALASSRSGKFVMDSEKSLDDLITKVPALADVKKIVVDDCKSKTTRSDAEAFCSCGAAITINMWRADEKMRTRLATYINSPSAAAAAAFVNYQGPELYSPTCSDALGGP